LTGEAQRIRLATQIGSGSLASSTLDEPSIGLHQREWALAANADQTARLGQHLDCGGVMKKPSAADHIVDIGPGAGVMGEIAQVTWRLLRAGSLLVPTYQGRVIETR